jgi:hypothetical protein
MVQPRRSRARGEGRSRSTAASSCSSYRRHPRTTRVMSARPIAAVLEFAGTSVRSHLGPWQVRHAGDRGLRMTVRDARVDQPRRQRPTARLRANGPSWSRASERVCRRCWASLVRRGGRDLPGTCSRIYASPYSRAALSHMILRLLSSDTPSNEAVSSIACM